VRVESKVVSIPPVTNPRTVSGKHLTTITTMKKIVTPLTISLLFACGQASKPKQESVDTITNYNNSTVITSNETDSEDNTYQDFHGSYIQLTNNKIFIDSLRPLSYFDTIEQLEQVEKIFENPVNPRKIKFSTKKINREDFKDVSYFIEKWAISYEFAAGLILQKNREKKKKVDVLF